jgi:hypothetical protein
VALIVENNISLDPLDIGFLCSETIVSQAHFIAHTIEQSGLWHRNLLVPAVYEMCSPIDYYVIVIEYKYAGISGHPE